MMKILEGLASLCTSLGAAALLGAILVGSDVKADYPIASPSPGPMPVESCGCSGKDINFSCPGDGEECAESPFCEDCSCGYDDMDQIVCN